VTPCKLFIIINPSTVFC